MYVFVSTLAFHASNVEVRGQLVGEAGSLSTMFMLGTELRPSFGVSITSARHNIWLLTCVLGLNAGPHLEGQELC